MHNIIIILILKCSPFTAARFSIKTKPMIHDIDTGADIKIPVLHMMQHAVPQVTVVGVPRGTA